MEVIDLWFELRAIRDILASDIEVTLVKLKKRGECSRQVFDTIEVVKSQCGDLERNIKEIFEVQIDIECLAFLSLPSSDKSLL